MHIGIIIGTGMDSITPAEQWSEVSTPYGSAHLTTATLDNTEVLLLRRHGPQLNIPPHLINHRANVWALRHMGARSVIATAAVGTMRKDMRPGTLAVVSDFIDFTRQQVSTFCDQPGEAVVHLDYSTPFCPKIASSLEQTAAEQGVSMGRRVVYVCVDGPRYETPAEVRMFTLWGGDVIGMTAAPEAILTRELGMCYGVLAILTNYAAGVSDKTLSHEEVVACMNERRQDVIKILSSAVVKIPEKCTCCP